MSTFPITAGGPSASSSISAENLSAGAKLHAIMLARHDALKDLVEKQAGQVGALNEQLRSLSMKKAELASKHNPTDEDKSRLAALDAEMASVVSMQSLEMTKLQDLASKMNQSLEAMTAIARQFRDESAEFIANLR
ncbi:hypothetical protein ABE485_04570 [Achromobacter spanius]|uniref:hypothetical protein n=1 Tax=Achromobacter spanius TaxID=217203 RepID=UPI003208BD67